MKLKRRHTHRNGTAAASAYAAANAFSDRQLPIAQRRERELCGLALETAKPGIIENVKRYVVGAVVPLTGLAQRILADLGRRRSRRGDNAALVRRYVHQVPEGDQ